MFSHLYVCARACVHERFKEKVRFENSITWKWNHMLINGLPYVLMLKNKRAHSHRTTPANNLKVSKNQNEETPNHINDRMIARWIAFNNASDKLLFWTRKRIVRDTARTKQGIEFRLVHRGNARALTKTGKNKNNVCAKWISLCFALFAVRDSLRFVCCVAFLVRVFDSKIWFHSN